MTDPALTNLRVEAGPLQSVFVLVVSDPVLPATLQDQTSASPPVFSLESFVLTSLLQRLYDVPGLEVGGKADVPVGGVESQLELGDDGETSVTQQVVRHVERSLLLVTQPGWPELHLLPGQ